MMFYDLDDQYMPIDYNGLNISDWLFVSDHDDVLFQALDQGNTVQRFNVGISNELSKLVVLLSIRDMVDKLSLTRNGFSKRRLVKFVIDRLAHDRRSAFNPKMILEKFVWLPKWGIELSKRFTKSRCLKFWVLWSEHWQSNQGIWLSGSLTHVQS